MSTTWVLCSILDPYINKITDNIYLYFPCHCANDLPKVKGIEFDQYSLLVLVEHTLCLIVSVAAAYHLTTGILDVTN